MQAQVNTSSHVCGPVKFSPLLLARGPIQAATPQASACRQPTSIVARVHALRPHERPCLRLLEVVLQPPLPILLFLCYCYIEGFAIDLHAKGSSCWEPSRTVTDS